MNHLAVFESVDRDLPVPGADHAATRAAIRLAIEATSVVIEGEPLADAELATAEEAWLIAWGASMDDGYMFYVVPASEVDAPLAAVFRRADGVYLEPGIGGTAERNPEGWNAWQAVALLLGAPTDPNYTPGELATRAGALAPFFIGDPHTGNVNARSLDRRFVGVVHGYEFL